MPASFPSNHIQPRLRQQPLEHIVPVIARRREEVVGVGDGAVVVGLEFLGVFDAVHPAFVVVGGGGLGGA